MKLVKEIKPLDGTAVRCVADPCERPALFLFVAAGSRTGRWAYCEEHAIDRAWQEKLELPTEIAATAVVFWSGKAGKQCFPWMSRFLKTRAASPPGDVECERGSTGTPTAPAPFPGGVSTGLPVSCAAPLERVVPTR